MQERQSRSLRKSFNRVARHAAVTALLAATVLTFMGDSLPKSFAPDPVATDVDAPVPQARVDDMRARLAAVPLGQELLDFADHLGIRIEMSNSRKMDAEPDDKLFIRGLNHVTSIELNNEETDDAVLMYTLVHELRHSWHRAIGVNDPELLPKQGWIRDRVLEADCFAFEIHFGYEYAKAKGIASDAGDGDYAKLAQAYATDRDTGMTPEKAYGRLLERAFPHVHSLDYDDDFLARQLRNWEAVVKEPCLGVHISETWNDVPDTARFAALLRRATTVGLHLDKAPSALAHWPDADFDSLKKTGGADPADLKKLAKADEKLGEAKTAWDVYIKDLTAQIRKDRELREASGSTAQPKAAPTTKAAL